MRTKDPFEGFTGIEDNQKSEDSFKGFAGVKDRKKKDPPSSKDLSDTGGTKELPDPTDAENPVSIDVTPAESETVADPDEKELEDRLFLDRMGDAWKTGRANREINNVLSEMMAHEEEVDVNAVPEQTSVDEVRTFDAEPIGGVKRKSIDPETGFEKLKELQKKLDDIPKSTAKKHLEGILQNEELSQWDKTKEIAVLAATNPSLIAEMNVESMSSSPEAILLTTLGSLGGGAGFVAGAFLGSATAEEANAIANLLTQNEVDISDKESLMAFLNDPDKKEDIMDKARDRGYAVGTVDALSSLLTLRLNKIVPTSALSEITKRGKQLTAETLSEGVGELAGQAAEGGRADLAEAALESISSGGKSVVDTGIGVALDKTKVKDTPEAVPSDEVSPTDTAPPVQEDTQVEAPPSPVQEKEALTENEPIEKNEQPKVEKTDEKVQNPKDTNLTDKQPDRTQPDKDEPVKKSIWNNEAIKTGKKGEREQITNPESKDLQYNKKQNKLAEKEAKRIVKDHSLEEAEEAAVDLTNDMDGMIRSKLLLEVVKAHKKSGNLEKSDEVFRVYEEKGTDVASELQIRAEAMDDPDIKTSKIIRNVQQATDTKLEQQEDNGKTVKENLAKEYEELTQTARKYGLEVMEGDTVSSVIDKIVQKATATPEGKRQVSKAKIARARQTRKSLIAQLKEANKPNKAQANVIPLLTPENVELAVKIAKTYVDEGVANIEVLTSKVKEALTEAGLDYSEEDLNTIKEEIVKGGLDATDLNQQIRGMITDSMQGKEAGMQAISDRLIKDYGISKNDAKRLQEAIQTEVSARMEQASEQYLKQVSNRANRKVSPKQVKQSYQKLIELMNAGNLTEETYRNQVLEDMGYVTVNSEAIKALNEASDALQRLPDGKVKRRAIDAFNEQADRLKSENPNAYKKALESLTDIIYTNMLSGLSTQFVALVGGLSSSLSGGASAILANPIATVARMRSNITKGMKESGIAGYMDAWREGASDFDFFKEYQPQGRGFTDKLVSTPFKKLWKEGKYFQALYKYPTTLPVYMYRNLLGMDAFLKAGIKENEAYIAEYNRLLKESNLSRFDRDFYKELDRRLARDNETLKELEQEVKAETKQLEKEGFKVSKRDEKQRLAEKIDERRREETVRQSIDAANSAFLMNDPVGHVGMLYRWLTNNLTLKETDTKALLTLKFLGRIAAFPFNRVASNYLNKSLDYGLGGVRAAIGSTPLRDGKRHQYTVEEKQRMIAKNAIGVAALAGMFVNMFEWDEDDEISLDDDRVIEITAGGKGDFYKNNSLSDDYQEYSIRFKVDGKWTDWQSYKYNPVGLMLAPLGMIYDQLVFKKFDKEVSRRGNDLNTSAGHLMGSAFMSIPKYLSSQTYAQGVEIMQDVIAGLVDEDKDAVRPLNKFLSRPAATAIMPNLYKQMYGQVKVAMDIPQKDARGAMRYIARDNFLLEQLLDNKKYDQFGYEIVKDADVLIPGVLAKFINKNVKSRQKHRIWQFLDKHEQVHIAPVYAPNRIGDKELTDDEKHAYERSVGLYLRGSMESWIDSNPDPDAVSSVTLQKLLNQYRSIAKKRAEMDFKYRD